MYTKDGLINRQFGEKRVEDANPDIRQTQAALKNTHTNTHMSHTQSHIGHTHPLTQTHIEHTFGPGRTAFVLSFLYCCLGCFGPFGI